MRRLVNVFICTVLLFGVLLGPAQPRRVSAAPAPECNEAYLRSIGVAMVNCTGNTSCEGDTAFVDGEEKLDYAGRPILSSSQLQQIAANQSFYESAATKVNIPWEMIAVIHKNESNLGRDNPGNGQGIYQFVNMNGGPYPTGPVTDEEFQRQTDLAAEFIKGKVPAGKTLTADNPDIATVKDTFFGYNGRAGVYADQAAALGFNRDSQPFEGSPYVMNKIDARRDPAVEPTKSNRTWGQIKTDGGSISYPANDFYGAFTAFAALAGVSFTGSGLCGTSQGGALAQEVIRIAEQELAAGAKESDGSHQKYGGSQGAPWCGYFVSWVFEQAGSPFEDGALPAVSGILDYARDKGIFFEPDDPNFAPQPGDVAIYKNEVGPYPSHVHFVISYDAQTKTYVSIGGNEGDSIRKRSNSMDSISLTGFMRR